METSIAESQTDSSFPTKWPNGFLKQQKCKQHTHSKTNYNKNKPWQKDRLGTVSEKDFTRGLNNDNFLLFSIILKLHKISPPVKRDNAW